MYIYNILYYVIVYAYSNSYICLTYNYLGMLWYFLYVFTKYSQLTTNFHSDAYWIDMFMRVKGQHIKSLCMLCICKTGCTKFKFLYFNLLQKLISFNCFLIKFRSKFYLQILQDNQFVDFSKCLIILILIHLIGEFCALHLICQSMAMVYSTALWPLRNIIECSWVLKTILYGTSFCVCA